MNIFLKNIILKFILWSKLPIISYCSPSVIKSNCDEVILRIPLKRRTRNHLKSMYFGALCVGADFSGGLLTLNIIKKHKSKANLIFKDFHADFLKRADSDVQFICKDSSVIEEGVINNLKNNKRVNFNINVEAFCNNKLIAKFRLTTSIK